jgi:hypothetical protein
MRGGHKKHRLRGAVGGDQVVGNILLSLYTKAQTIMSSLRDERGQDIMEYAVIASAIAIGAAIVLFAFDFQGAFLDFADVVGDCIAFDDNCGA